MPEGNTVIYQDLDPSSFIKKNGSFEYKWDKQIISLCKNEKSEKQLQVQQALQICKPALMKLEVNKDKKFALIPVRLKSNEDGVDEEVSLKYEIDNGSKFIFLGARPEIKEQCSKLLPQELCKPLLQQVVPKENWPLSHNDNIYPTVYSFDSEDDNIGDLRLEEYPAMQVGENFKPKYVHFNGTYNIIFRVCDYSNNCWSTRWFHFNDTSQTIPQIIDLGRQNITSCDENTTLENFSIYRNPLFKLNIHYPSNWQKVEEGYPDDDLVHFYSAEANKEGISYAQLSISAGYWPGTYKEFLNDINSTSIYSPFSKTVKINSTTLGNYPAYEKITMERSNQIMDIDALIGRTWYTITFISDSSKYSNYLPYVKKLINSFQLCMDKQSTKVSQIGNHTDEVQSNSQNDNRNTTLLVNSTEKINKYLVYKSPIFKILYASYWKLLEDIKGRKVIFYSPTAIMPSFSSFDRRVSIVQFRVTEIGNSSLLYKLGMSLKNLLLSYLIVQRKGM